MKVCRDVEEWIQENVEQEVEQQEERCKEWPWPLSWLCSIVTFIVKIVVVVVTKVIRVVCEIVNVIANAIAALFNLVLTIPILGPAIKALIRVFTAVLSYVVGLVDGLGRLIGIRITKHLRVHVIPLCEGVVPLANEEHLAAAMTETARILYARAQIRVHVTFHEPILNPPENALRIGTGVDLIADEAWLKGSWHQLQAIKLFEANFWSLIGIGQPVIVYVVREVGYDGPGTVVGAPGDSSRIGLLLSVTPSLTVSRRTLREWRLPRSRPFHPPCSHLRFLPRPRICCTSVTESMSSLMRFAIPSACWGMRMAVPAT